MTTSFSPLMSPQERAIPQSVLIIAPSSPEVTAIKQLLRQVTKSLVIVTPHVPQGDDFENYAALVADIDESETDEQLKHLPSEICDKLVVYSDRSVDRHSYGASRLVNKSEGLEALAHAVSSLAAYTEVYTPKISQENIVDFGQWPKSATMTDNVAPFWEQERLIIENALKVFNGNIGLAADALEISPSTIYRKRQSWLARA